VSVRALDEFREETRLLARRISANLRRLPLSRPYPPLTSERIARRFGYAGIVLAVLLGQPCTRADTAASTPTQDDTPVVLRTKATKPDRDRMGAKLSSAEGALPKPSSTFRLESEGQERAVGSDFGVLDDPGRFNPIEAWVSRIYETRTASEDDDRTLEIRLGVNGEHEFSPGLASVGGEATIVPSKGALAVRQTIIGAEGGARVALPLSDEDARRAPTILRLYVVTPDLESRLRRVVEETGQFPRIDVTQITAARPDAVAMIVVEIVGERRDVDALAPKVGIAALRPLLTP